MKDGGILADRYGRDEAIEPVPDPLAGGGTHPLDRGRSFPRLEATDGQEIQRQETAPDLGELRDPNGIPTGAPSRRVR